MNVVHKSLQGEQRFLDCRCRPRRFGSQIARGLDEAPARGRSIIDVKADWQVIHPAKQLHTSTDMKAPHRNPEYRIAILNGCARGRESIGLRSNSGTQCILMESAAKPPFQHCVGSYQSATYKPHPISRLISARYLRRPGRLHLRSLRAS